MEADLYRFYPGVDQERLRWRTRAALIRHLPLDSAVAGIGRDGPHWSVEAHLLDELRMTFLLIMGAEPKHVKPHPQRPKSVRPPDPVRLKKRADALRRSRERRQKIEAGEIT